MGAQFYLIGPNIDAVTGLGEAYEYTFIPSRFSTVALDVTVYDLPRDDEVRCGKLLEIFWIFRRRRSSTANRHRRLR